MNVAFLIYNRPALTARVFDAIRNARPETLLVVADGARCTEDARNCMSARAVTEAVDWPCRIHRNYADVNLGCRDRVASGIDWVFQHTDEAIILEDDCLPHPDFFPFCVELLGRYRGNERIGQIGGVNFEPKSRPRRESYHFSRYTSIWGWATWRRAWQYYDVSISRWPEIRESGEYRHWLPDRSMARYAAGRWDAVHDHRLDTWDWQWAFACLSKGMLTVRPSVNMVSNLGFGPGATHTVSSHPVGNRATFGIAFPLRHPQYVEEDRRADRQLVRTFHYEESGLRRFMRRQVLNKYWYGAMLRRLPLVGKVWAHRRSRIGTTTSDQRDMSTK